MRVVSGNLIGIGRPQKFIAYMLCGVATLLNVVAPIACAGVTPESAEVRKLVDSGLNYLSTNTDNRLGGKCLIALAFFKAGRTDHPRVREAIDACVAAVKANQPITDIDVYSNGLAIIFLCEVAPQKYASQIEWFLKGLKSRQKPHGGWGYHGLPAGDTSQSQYGALSYWEANRHGFAIDGASVEGLADWLLKTQGPDGCWGYQGIISTSGSPVPQDETNCSMLAAGLGSMYICADLFGMHPQISREIDPARTEENLPAALRPVIEGRSSGERKQIRPTKTSPAKVITSINSAHGWMEQNYKIDIGPKCFYYLYGLERYKSFQAAFEGDESKSPQWYNDGYEFLAKSQQQDGSWRGYCQPECDTAFSILFLIRSTQKSITAKLGEGMLLAGRGLPTNLSRAKLQNGQLIVDQVHTKVDELLNMIDAGDDARLDDLARDPTQLVVEQVDEKNARRLQQLVRGGEPPVRLLAVRALGRSGNLDYVPSLLYALTDPDHRVVLEARNELRFISRSFDSGGPPDDFTEQQRYEAIQGWKKWYLSIRPDTVLE
jgi:HEAT repeats/Prenyltransferase and squalene oxidase repeat